MSKQQKEEMAEKEHFEEVIIAPDGSAYPKSDIVNYNFLMIGDKWHGAKIKKDAK